MKINLVVILALISISCSSNDPNNSTNIEQGELRLLIDKSHRRTRTVG